MSDEYFDYTNSEKILQTTKEQLFEKCKNDILNQDQNEENYKIVRWIIDCLYEFDYGKYKYILDWRNQTGEVLEKSVEMLFRIYRQFNGITLTDNEFVLLVNFCSVMYNINLKNFTNFTQAIKSIFTDAIITYDDWQKTMFIFLDFSDSFLKILQGIIYYKLFPTIPVASYCLVKKKQYATTYDAAARNVLSAKPSIFNHFTDAREQKYILPLISAKDMYYC